METVDLASWSRREIFDFFSPISNPFYALSFRLDVTKLRSWTKERGLSFYHSLIWLCTRALERVEAFSYALSDGNVVRLESRRHSFTHLPAGSEQFRIVTLPCEGSLEDFCAAAAFLLPTGGRFCLVYRPERLTALLGCLHESGLEPKRLRFVSQRAESAPSLVLAEGRRGGKPGLVIEPPLILTDAEGRESAEVRRIYRREE